MTRRPFRAAQLPAGRAPRANADAERWAPNAVAGPGPRPARILSTMPMRPRVNASRAAGMVGEAWMNGLGRSMRALPVRVALIVAGLLLLMPATATAKPADPGVTPIVLFPAW